MVLDRHETVAYIPLNKLLEGESMQCPFCEHKYEHDWKEEDDNAKEDEFFYFKKGSPFKREIYLKNGIARTEYLDAYGCPKCMKIFMG